MLPPQRLADSEAVRRFRREALCLSALQHPHIVTIFALEETADALCLVMEHVPGKTLAQCLAAGALGMERAMAYARQIAQALAAAHEQGIIHRDLKPSNILVTEKGDVKVVDFGLAKIVNTSLTAQDQGTLDGTILGTADYMSPEQARGQAADARSDVFSFGTLFYEMLTGQRLFRRPSPVETLNAILKDSVPDPGPQVPKPVLRILRRCLAKSPDERYQTSAELVRDLNAAPEALRPRSIRGGFVWPQPRRVVLFAVPACLVLLIGMEYWRMGGNPFVTAAGETTGPATLFESALAEYGQAITSGCFEDHTMPCDLKLARAHLEASLADWDQLDRLRPHHASSLWNRALTEQGFCELLSRSEDWATARNACEKAITHFSESLLPGASYVELPHRRPDEADVLWNRGLTHAMRARLPDLGGDAKRAAFSRAIDDFDRVLYGPSRYATFLEKRRAEVAQERSAVDRERAAVGVPPAR
jgi:hypothetical protein